MNAVTSVPFADLIIGEIPKISAKEKDGRWLQSYAIVTTARE